MNAGEYALLKTGEEAGNLPYVISRIRKLREVKRKATGGLVGAVAYPFFVLFIFFGMIYFISSQAISQIVKGFGEKVQTPMLKLVLFISDPKVIALFFLTLFLITATLLIIMFKVHQPFRAKLDRFFPFSVYRFYQGVVFLYVYSILLKNGYREEQALELISKLSGYYRLVFAEVLKYIRAGKGIGDALRISGYHLPDEETVDLLRAIQGTGLVFQEKLPEIAEQKIEEVSERIKNANSVIRNIAILIVGVLIMIYVGGFMSMIQNVMQELLFKRSF